MTDSFHSIRFIKLVLGAPEFAEKSIMNGDGCRTKKLLADFAANLGNPKRSKRFSVLKGRNNKAQSGAQRNSGFPRIIRQSPVRAGHPSNQLQVAGGASTFPCFALTGLLFRPVGTQGCAALALGFDVPSFQD